MLPSGLPRTVGDRGLSALRTAPRLRDIASLAIGRDVADDLAAAPVTIAAPEHPSTTLGASGTAPTVSFAPEVAPIPAIARDVMTLRGEYWEVKYQQHAGVVPDCRGLRYIAVLVRDAGSGKDPIHAKELTALATGQPGGAIELEIDDAVLDSKAKKQLMKRLEEIAFERDRAVAVEDFTRAASLDDEYEQIADELGRTSAPRGASRRNTPFVHAGEKARKAVAKAIVEAIDKIAAHPDLTPLAEHLASTIRKGQWLSYTGSIDWHIEFRAPLPRK